MSQCANIGPQLWLKCGTAVATPKDMTPFRFPSPLLALAASVALPLLAAGRAEGLVPPDTAGDGDGSGADIDLGEVAAPPPMVYLSRYTYYEGEVIVGQVDCPDCYPDGPLFYDANTGTEIPGTIVYSETNYGTFAFIPDTQLPIGVYSVQLDYYGSAAFEVVAGDPSPPTPVAGAFEVPQGVGEPIVCQAYAPGTSAESYPQTRVDAGITIALQGESIDQYEYEVILDGEAERFPLYSRYPLLTTRQGDGEVCMEVFAIPYTNEPESSLGTTCINPDDELMLGLRDEPYGSIENVLRLCELPPDGYFDDWCAVFAEAFTRHSCQGFVETACVEARYDCPAGDLPEWYEENGIDPDDPDAPNNPDPDQDADADDSDEGSGSSSDAGGCSCSTGAGAVGPNNTGLLLAALGGALIALRRRQRSLFSS